MDEQMEMALGQAETVDPVSGNDVPPGSLPEEVRDDIDAKLSEGEYVVPADVVRFFGVKFFEDLRMEAKMGLQQMDADGRIGGEPVPAEAPQVEDSEDLAKLKAALSESGMYAGGLTDGGTLDNFIDDASRSPMVNGRMRASGATVNMAVGGLIPTGTYGDATKVDGIIKQLMTAANKDPALMEKLASKGIMVNKTGADKKSAEMQQANKPQEPIEAREGTLVSPKDQTLPQFPRNQAGKVVLTNQTIPKFPIGSFGQTVLPSQTDPFDSFRNFGTLGGSSFSFGAASEEEEDFIKKYLNPKGIPRVVILIDPDGNEIPVAWNTKMKIPEGFTLKDDLSYESYLAGTSKTEASGLTSVPYSMGTEDEDRKTGDDSDSGPYGQVTSANTRKDGSISSADKDGIGFLSVGDLSEKTTKQLTDMLNKNKKIGKTTTVLSMAAGLNPLVALGANAFMAMKGSSQKRQVNEELKRRKEESIEKGEWDSLNKDEKNAIEAALKQTDPRLKASKNRFGPKEYEERGPLGQFFADIGDAIFGDVSGNKSGSSSSSTEKVQNVQERSINNAVQQVLNVEKQEKQAAADQQASQAAQARQQVRAGMQRQDFRPTGNRQLDEQRARNLEAGIITRVDQGGYQYSGPASGMQEYRNQQDAAQSRRRTDAINKSFGTSFGYGSTGDASSGNYRSYTGGLVSMPAAKQNNKKQTTQRRKGLGTRP